MPLGLRDSPRARFGGRSGCVCVRSASGLLQVMSESVAHQDVGGVRSMQPQSAGWAGVVPWRIVLGVGIAQIRNAEVRSGACTRALNLARSMAVKTRRAQSMQTRIRQT